jgi:hypothetical protein
METTFNGKQLISFDYLCTQTNYTLFVRYCSHYTFADSLVVLSLLSLIYPSPLLPFRMALFCSADSTDNVESGVECLYTTSNKDSNAPNCSILREDILKVKMGF